MKYTTVFLDTETTGNNPDDRLCQLCYLHRAGAERIIHNENYRPAKPISIESMAIHHITNKMVADLPLFMDSPGYPTIKSFLETPNTVIIAHNAPFDRGMLAQEAVYPDKWIDTLKLIRFLDPTMELKRHNLQYLRYYFEVDDHLTEPIHAHDALGDVLVLEQLFIHILAELKKQEPHLSDDETIDRMIDISNQPAFIPKVTFGKYTGKTVWDIAKIDRGYLEWLLRQKKQDTAIGKDETDWIFTLETVLKETN